MLDSHTCEEGKLSESESIFVTLLLILINFRVQWLHKCNVTLHVF